MKYGIISVLILSVLTVSSVLGAFPLKKINKGDVVPIVEFKGLNKDIAEVNKNSKIKVLLLWRNDKRTNIETFKNFVEMCSSKDISCVAVDLLNRSFKKINGIVGKVSENIYLAHDSKGITDNWGIFTLPVTIFLDKDNKVINAVGYEGQYTVKVGRYVDFLTGKISEKEYKKYENTNMVKNERSKLPQINFIKRLIKDGQPEDAKKRLKEIDTTNLDMEEKFNLAEVYLMLENPDKVYDVLEGVAEFNMQAKFYRAYATYQKKDLDKALEMLHSMENVYPKKKEIYYLIGKIYKEKGDYKNAAKYFEMSCDKSDILS